MDAAAESPPLPPPLPLGQILAAERERQGLSRADAAHRLHMSAWQVEALENGDYERLPKGTFLRGFVRNYTKVLGLNSEAALDALSHAAPNSPAPPIVVPTQNIRFEPIGQRLSQPYVKATLLAGVVVALGSASMYWWLNVRPEPPATRVAAKQAAPHPAPQNLAAAPMQEPDPVQPRDAPRIEEPVQAQVAPKPGPKAAPSAPAVVPAPAQPSSPSATPASPVGPPATRPSKPPDIVATGIMPVQSQRPVAGSRTLKLRFKGAAWVEVRERGGKVLLSRLNEPGSEAEVSGRPPFNVVVGNAPSVTVLYEDREIPLEPHTKVAVARFTLE